MKTLRLFPLLLVLSSPLMTFAQAVSEGPQPFIKKVSGNALSVVFTGQPDNVEHVLENWLEEASGKKAATRSGFRALEGVVVSAFSPNALDYYLLVEKVSRDDNTHSKATLFVSAGNDNFISRGSNPEVMNQVVAWLESMQKEINIYELELAVEAQQKVIEKAIKVQESLHRDSVRLQSTLAETLAAIETNKATNVTQRQTIASEQEKLQAFREQLSAVQQGTEAIMRTDQPAPAAGSAPAQPSSSPAPGSGGGGNNRP